MRQSYRSTSFLSPLRDVCSDKLLFGPITNPFLDIELYAEGDQSGTKLRYKPIIFPNDFWLLRSQFTEINSTTPQLPLQVTFQPMSYWKFQIFASMTQGFDDAAKQGGASGAELDEIKRMLVETNPWFLGLTGLVSVLHMVYVPLVASNNP